MKTTFTKLLTTISGLCMLFIMSGCTLLDDTNAYIFDDYETELSSITSYTKQMFSENILNTASEFDVDPYTPGNDPIYLDEIDVAYSTTDIYDLDPVSGLRTSQVTDVTSNGTIATLNYTQSLSVTPNIGSISIEKFVQKTVTSISSTQNEVETIVSGNMSISVTNNISFAFENFNFTTTIENDVDGSNETLADITISASFPFTLTYNATVLTGTMTASSASASSAISLGGNIQNDGLDIGTLFITWDSWDDFLEAAPRVIVRDQQTEIVPEL